MFTKRIPNESKFLMAVISGASLFGIKVAYSKLRYDPGVYVSKNSRHNVNIDKFLIQ